MENKKLLSILIPTYNRANCLDNCLNSIFSQIDEEISKKIEIIVSNNASVDNTEEIMKKYMKYENVDYKYSSNETNINMDGNFYKLINQGKGKYCWLLGDNEFLLDGSLTYILSNIENFGNEVGLFYLNNSDRKEELKFYNNPNKFLRRVNYMITFISAVIFKKNETYKVNFNECKDSYLTQLYFYFDTLLKNKNNVIVSKKIFSCIDVENGGYRLFKVFSNNFNMILLKFKKVGLKEETINAINKKMCIEFFPKWIVKLKSEKNLFEKEDILKILLTYQKSYFYFWIFCYPLIKLPNFLGKIYYFFIRVLIKIHNVKFKYFNKEVF